MINNKKTNTDNVKFDNKACHKLLIEYFKLNNTPTDSNDNVDNKKLLITLKQRIAEINQPLVSFVMNKYFPVNNTINSQRAARINSYETRQEMFQEGMIGLMNSIDGFDPDLGYQFSTYSTWWIKQAINNFIMNDVPVIKIPNHIRSIQNKLMKEFGTKTEYELLDILLKKYSGFSNHNNTNHDGDGDGEEEDDHDEQQDNENVISSKKCVIRIKEENGKTKKVSQKAINSVICAIKSKGQFLSINYALTGSASTSSSNGSDQSSPNNNNHHHHHHSNNNNSMSSLQNILNIEDETTSEVNIDNEKLIQVIAKTLQEMDKSKRLVLLLRFGVIKSQDIKEHLLS